MHRLQGRYLQQLISKTGMTEVPLHPSGYPCKCNGNCDYSKAYEDAGKPQFIDFKKYIQKGFITMTTEEIYIQNYLRTLLTV